MPYTYDYPRPALAVDCVVFGYQANAALKLLLIRRRLPPYQGQWALPGGFVRIDESVDAAAERELKEETGVADVFLEQLYTFGAIERDSRDRIVTVAYYALINLSAYPVQAASDAAAAQWFEVAHLQALGPASWPVLGFDHAEIVACALARLRAKIRYEPIGFELLPQVFTLTQLQKLYEQILECDLEQT